MKNIIKLIISIATIGGVLFFIYSCVKEFLGLKGISIEQPLDDEIFDD